MRRPNTSHHAPSPRSLPLRRLRACAAPLFAAVVLPAMAHAQRSPAVSNDGTTPSTTGARATGPEETVLMNQFIISSSVTPRRQIDSAVSVTTVDQAQLAAAQPRSAADLIQVVPGFYVEPSGGESRNNVFARGLSTGGYQYIALQEDGLPVVSVSNIAFSNADLWTRMTNWVSRVEAIRGGTAGIFQSNAPAGVINFIGREGTTVQQGELLLQTTDYEQIRTDAWTSGPLGDQTTYAFGLTYRRDRGIRDPGFTGNEGHWMQGNIKHTLPTGHVKLYGKYMRDRSIFYYPFPLADIRNPRSIPGGIDIREGSGVSNDLRIFHFEDTPDGDLHFDLRDGDYVPLYMGGLEVQLDLPGEWRLLERARYTYTPHTSDQIQFSSIATPLQTLVNQIGNSAASAGQFAAARDASGNYRYQLSIPGAGNQVVADPAMFNGNGLGSLSSQRHTFNHIRNFQNDLRLLKTFGDETTLAAGLYYAWIEVDVYRQLQTWLTEIRNMPRRLDVTFQDAATGAVIGPGTYQGIRQLGADYRRTTADQDTFAGYINLDRKVGKWQFDAGYRYEIMDAHQRAQVAALYDMNQPGGTIPALRNARFGSGSWNDIDYGEFKGSAFTAAANYTFNPGLSAYGRYSRGFYFPITDQFEIAAAANNRYAGPTTKLDQAEAGIKYSQRNLAIFATAFGGWVKDQPFTGVIVQPDGTIAPLAVNRDIFSRGIELELFYSPIKPLLFHFTGTWQRAQFTSNNLVSGTDSQGQTIAVPIKDNDVVRVPKLYFTAAVKYTLPELQIGQVSLDLSWTYIGDRYTDEANRGVLQAYDLVNAGVAVTRGRFAYRVQVQNLLNGDGLTEGDPRLSMFVADPNAQYMNARPILPRNLVASVTYSF